MYLLAHRVFFLSFFQMLRGPERFGVEGGSFPGLSRSSLRKDAPGQRALGTVESYSLQFLNGFYETITQVMILPVIVTYSAMSRTTIVSLIDLLALPLTLALK